MGVRRGQLKAGTGVWACVPEMEGRGDLGEVSGLAVPQARCGRETADWWGRGGSEGRSTHAALRRARLGCGDGSCGEAGFWAKRGKGKELG